MSKKTKDMGNCHTSIEEIRKHDDETEFIFFYTNHVIDNYGHAYMIPVNDYADFYEKVYGTPYTGNRHDEAFRAAKNALSR